MRALVLGGSGYVGNAVVHALIERGVDVVSLSRSGETVASRSVRGDVRASGLRLAPADARELRATITHFVSCFGSVDWSCGPRVATELHRQGTRNVLSFAASCAAPQRIVHLSSVLALGRAEGRVTHELELGQSFRNWYEYGKYLAEREVRASDSVDWRIVRVGAVVGPGRGVPPDASHGLLSAVPFLLRGYPVHMAEQGRFPSYACDVQTLGDVLARAVLDEGSGEVWTWFDEQMPSVADVLVGVCSAWGVVPRIVVLRPLRAIMRAAAGRLGGAPELLEYVEPWTEIPREVLAELPADLPSCPAGYVEATGEVLRRHSASLVGIGRKAVA